MSTFAPLPWVCRPALAVCGVVFCGLVAWTTPARAAAAQATDGPPVLSDPQPPANNDGPPVTPLPLGLPTPPAYPDSPPQGVAPAPGSVPPPVAAPAVPPVAAPAVPPPPIIFNGHVPRAGSIAVGWTYTPSNNLPLSSYTPLYTPSGVDIDARFGWQVGGIARGWPAWIGFMAGFFYYVGDQGISDSYGIDYGLFVKHALFPGRRFRLFLSYGLGVAQVWVKDVGGRGIGHLTRLSAGLDTRISDNVHFTVEFAYKLVMLPAFAIGNTDPVNYNFQAINLLAGLWFGK